MKVRLSQLAMNCFAEGSIHRPFQNEWWLDVVEASNRMPNGGAYIPPEVCWGAWTFPLPHEHSVGAERGLNLAWTAMQLEWSQFAEDFKICQITEPTRVHEFIERFPGLSELCEQYPTHLTFYAPQLTIPSFSGKFAPIFDAAMAQSIQQYLARRNSTFGTALSTDGAPPLCDEEWCLRHPTFGNYKPTSVAYFFCQGEMFSPKIGFSSLFEYLVWLLTEHSHWLPAKYRDVLLLGMRSCSWWSVSSQEYDTGNDFLERLFAARSAKSFRFTKRCKAALGEMIGTALDQLQCESSIDRVVSQFIELGFVEAYFAEQEKRRKMR